MTNTKSKVSFIHIRCVICNNCGHSEHISYVKFDDKLINDVKCIKCKAILFAKDK